MRLWLSSNGITNDALEQSFRELVDADISSLSCVYIPTATLIEPGDKSWMLDDLHFMHNLGHWKAFDIIDVAGRDRSLWMSRLEDADVVYASGGNELYLMRHLELSGAESIIRQRINDIVWAGFSAGAMVAGEFLGSTVSAELYGEETGKPLDDVDRFMDFSELAILPHYRSEEFPKVNDETLDAMAEWTPIPVYALDNDSALTVTADGTKVVGTGSWRQI